MTPYFKTVSGSLLGLLALAAILPMGGCDTFEPTRFPVGDTAVLYSLARAEHMGEVSAYDFIAPVAVVVERPKASNPPDAYTDFDVAFSEIDGQFVMLPAGMFQSFGIEPGILMDTSGDSFEEITRAPSSGYETDAAVPLSEGSIYIVRTRARSACSRYGKLEVLDLDDEGILEFRFLRNNLCNDRVLTEADAD